LDAEAERLVRLAKRAADDAATKRAAAARATEVATSKAAQADAAEAVAAEARTAAEAAVRASALALPPRPKAEDPAASTAVAIRVYLREQRARQGSRHYVDRMHRVLTEGFAPACPAKPAAIRESDIRGWLRRLAPLSVGAQLEAFGIGRAFTSWLVDRDLLSLDPFKGVRPPNPTSPHKAPTRDDVAKVRSTRPISLDRAAERLLDAAANGLCRPNGQSIADGDPFVIPDTGTETGQRPGILQRRRRGVGGRADEGPARP